MTIGGWTEIDSMRQPIFTHLQHLSDETGLFEHALRSSPRVEHGYCVDDVARGLVVLAREPEPTAAIVRLHERYLDFVLAALSSDGLCRNRMSVDGLWTDEPDLGDWWGRALWGLGCSAVDAPSAGMRARALGGFRIAAQARSPHRRSMTFAGLGAAQVLRQRPDETAARQLLHDAARAVDRPITDNEWPWPEPTLTYGNASIAEMLLVAGSLLDDAALQERGLHLLRFLLRLETRDGHLSVTPVGGRAASRLAAGFDQQPIEVASLADACASAYRITAEPAWLDACAMAWRWFCGDNDSATPMFDAATGGGYDGLERSGRNANQGAESTLAMLSTAQHARGLGQLL